MDNITPKISLSFTKIIGQKKLQSSALGGEKPETAQLLTKEAITCFDKNLQRSEPPKLEDTLIIPLVQSNRETLFKNIKEKSSSSSSPGNPIKEEKHEMSIDEQAAAALLEESARRLEELTNNKPLQQQVISVTNGVSDQDGETSTLDNYDQVNIEHFGAALLRGMGWNKNRGVGKNNKRVVEIIDPANRGGLSLTGKKKKMEKSEAKGNDSEELELKKGSNIFIEEGRNKGSYGIVECVDEDHVLVRLAREEKVVRDVEQNIRVVSAKEYKDFSRVINKAMYDDYKATEIKKKKELKKEKYSDDSAEFEKRKKRDYQKDQEKSSKRLEALKDVEQESKSTTHKSSLKDNEKEEKRLRDKVESSRGKKENYNDKLENSSYNRKSEKYEDKKKVKESKEFKDKKKMDTNNKPDTNVHSKPVIPWARENLRVRIIDKEYKGGKYHKEKVVVESIDTIESCTCITEEGKVLYDINPNHLESVIPKTSSAIVLIVKGNYKGQKARILELHKEKEKATIQLLEERSVILKLYYDDICEYISR